ncbi:HAMP domain-containing protein [Brevibacillus sp. SYP-B805]|uniref:methyl-accepting chemotaxis protein n=1 Tax=Brevibacillus sp. SYP-B805 TaxID=1578199 RepID=UPI0013EBB6AF|nr:methyl-accepting chemotaxis protein [Brevibacillus sp. SYP-B805]NGQ96841.1 HAMP domain-containing protein [Brevibacillus sp. SYP-B805]
MRIATRLKLTSGLVALLSILTIGSIFLLDVSFREQRNAVVRKEEFKRLGDELMASVVYLTEEARQYSIFGEQEHYANYQREKNETKTSERVIKRLTELNAPQEEIDLLKQAIAHLKEVEAQEEEAFRAVQEKNLPSARLLVFGSLYKEKQKRVLDPIKQFQETINQRAESEADAAIRRFELISYVTAGITMLLIGCVLTTFFLLYRKVTKPLSGITDVANQVASGNLRVAQLDSRGNDEIAQLSQAVNGMVVNLRQLLEQVSVTTEQVAASAEELSASMEQTTDTTNQIACSIQEVARGAETQRIGAEKGVHTMQELSNGIQRVAETAAVVAEASELTAREAEQGNEAIQQAVGQIKLIHDAVSDLASVIRVLGERSQEIGLIVEAINSISAQTNLLALNAAIEAARAGEHGRGFAVVADEVRKLAEQSQESAGRITALIAIIQADTTRAVEVMDTGSREVETGMRVVEKAGAAFDRILQAAQRAAAQVQEVSAAASQMSAGSRQVTAAVDEMMQIAVATEENARMVAAASEEQLAAMEEIAGTADSLSRMAQDLNDAIKKFAV